MPRYIDADKLLDLIRDHDAPPRYGYLDLWDIEDAQTEDVQPVVHAKWIPQYVSRLGLTDIFECSECNKTVHTIRKLYKLSYLYCPNCGAKMDKK